MVLEADNRKYTTYFIAFITAVAAIRLAVIGLSLITPQEAYYWNYARHPDWSYFDHPVAVSLLIKFGVSLFGDNSFGVRFGGVVSSIITALMIFYFARKLFSARVAFYAALLLNIIWIFAIGSVITTPDNPLFPFWVLNIIFIYYAVKRDSLAYFLLWGVAVGLGFDSKYTMVMALPSALLFLLLSGKLREFKPWFNFICGCAVAFILAFPVIYWNYLHNWASFVFQTTRRANEMSSFRFDMFFGFLGTQLAVVTPLIFPFAIYAIYQAGRRSIFNGDNRYKLFFSFAAPILLLFTLASFRGWVKMNWPTVGYITAIIALCAIFEEDIKSRQRWMRQGWHRYAAFSVAFAVALSGVSYINSFFPIIPLGKADTMAGWNDLGKLLGFYTIDHIVKNPENIIGYEYKIASEAAFYTFGRPDVKSDNYVAEHGLSYRFWSDPQKYIGEDFLFIYDSRYRYKPEKKLLDYFEYIVPEKPLKIYGIGGELFDFHFIRCYGYKGLSN